MRPKQALSIRRSFLRKAMARRCSMECRHYGPGTEEIKKASRSIHPGFGGGFGIDGFEGVGSLSIV